MTRPTERTRVIEREVATIKASYRNDFAALRRELDALKAEVRQLRSENDVLALAIAGRKR